MPGEQFDVVVVGGGGAGFAAAIEARSYGRDVVLLEKNPEVGGTTVWSVGSISASNSPHQIRAGIKDSPLHHWEDMPLFATHDKRTGKKGELTPPENGILRKVLTDNEPIPGLFAAGGVGQGGLLLLGHGHHIGWAFTSGRIAGRNAAFLATSEDLPEARSGSV